MTHLLHGDGSINSGSTSEDFAASNSRKRSTHNEDLGSSQKRSVHDDTLSYSSAGSNSCSNTLSNKSSEFKLPFFSRDVEEAIEKDQFYTSAKRSKLIREACRALKGHCRSGNRVVSSQDKKDLAKRLYKLAPKSLGDPQEISTRGSPEVYMHTHVEWHYVINPQYIDPELSPYVCKFICHTL